MKIYLYVESKEYTEASDGVYHSLWLTSGDGNPSERIEVGVTPEEFKRFKPGDSLDFELAQTTHVL
jgi:hypothetical protein